MKTPRLIVLFMVGLLAYASLLYVAFKVASILAIE